MHLIVGKTGSGKTNLLQLIGAKCDTRLTRRWQGEDDSYFLLYSINETEFFLEMCNVEVKQFPLAPMCEDPSMPEGVRANRERMHTVRTVRFAISQALPVGEMTSDFLIIREYGSNPMTTERVRDHSTIINCYDINSFIVPPYPDEKETGDDLQHDWIGRMVIPYHRTSLWKLCDYIREYISDVQGGDVKRNVAFVLTTHNFSDKYPIKLPNTVEDDYWTFFSLEQDLLRASFDNDVKLRLEKMKTHVEKLETLSKKATVYTRFMDRLCEVFAEMGF